MDYTKKGKTGTLKLDQVKARQLATGIGSDQDDMCAQGAYRMNCVADAIPPKQAAVAPASIKAKPPIPAGYDICPAEMTPGGPDTV